MNAALQEKKPGMVIYLIAYLLLALFTANSANKFFVNELEADEEPYTRITVFTGDAPDQYRILPVLPYLLLKQEIPVLHRRLGFNHQVLLYNILFCFLTLLLFHFLLKDTPVRFLAGFQVIFCLSYIYFLHSGWRPDTMGVVFLCSSIALAWEQFGEKRGILSFLLALSVLALSFARAEIALMYAVYALFYLRVPLVVRILCLPVPLIIQALLKFVLFPEATYYTKVFMLWDNLGLFYLYRNPGTYLIPAVLILFFNPVRQYVVHVWQQKKLLLLMLAGYLLLILFVGRINEWRLYLPFLPLFILEIPGYLAARKLVKNT